MATGSIKNTAIKRIEKKFTNITISSAGGYALLSTWEGLGIDRANVVGVLEISKPGNGVSSYQCSSGGLYVYNTATVSGGSFQLAILYTL